VGVYACVQGLKDYEESYVKNEKEKVSEILKNSGQIQCFLW
jgi:uncharacterized phosphosugar-binding protein